MALTGRKRLGDLLIEAGFITQQQLAEALEAQKGSGIKLGEILLKRNLVSETQIIHALEKLMGIKYVNLENYMIEPDAPTLIGENLARKHKIIPIGRRGSILTVAMEDPLNIFAIEDVRMVTGLEVVPVVSRAQEILNAIEQHYGKVVAQEAVDDFRKQYGTEELSDIDTETLNEINSAPVVRLVNSLIRQAIKAGASDIHVEPYEDHVRIRFRIDGELQEIMSPAKSTHAAMVTRIKIMGNMDIAERRKTQDGRVETVVDGRGVDMRISILPSIYGEKVVIRLLDRGNMAFGKVQLGFSEAAMSEFDRIISSPHGVILVTGPTGSGKTTTLYAALKELNKDNVNIVTLEDPVEYRLDGITQVHVNPKADLTFANGLRSILRQDPDIIMVGEIRDAETAQIAVRAAITGHLVLSTVHTNDTASTVSRLVDMGVEPYLVSASVVGIIAQRLVRKTCEICGAVYEADEVTANLLDVEPGTQLRRGPGCPACSFTGYRGRTAIFEIMPMYVDIRKLIDDRATVEEIRAAAGRHNMITLRDNCRRLVLEGVTTVDELLRVTYTVD